MKGRCLNQLDQGAMMETAAGLEPAALYLLVVGVVLHRFAVVMELPTGIEPATCRLQVGCSTY